MFRLVRLESDPAREDRPILRLNDNASPESLRSGRSAPIPKKRKSPPKRNPAPNSSFTPNSFSYPLAPANYLLNKTPPKPKNGIGGNFIFPADRITMRRSYLISANMKYQYP